MTSKFDNIINKWKDIYNDRHTYRKSLSKEKKLVGWMLEYCPIELIHSLGYHPVPLWGEEINISEANRYMPVFYCHPIRSTLEFGITGKLSYLSAILIPSVCDSLKSIGQNWKVGVPDIPIIQFVHPQNRFSKGAVSYLIDEYYRVIKELELIGLSKFNKEQLLKSIKYYKNRDKIVRELVSHLYQLPNSSHKLSTLTYAMALELDVEEFNRDASVLIDFLKNMDKEKPKNPVMIIGITSDNKALIEALDESRIHVVSDDTAKGARQYSYDLDFRGENPLEELALKWIKHPGCSLAYSSTKERILKLKKEIIDKDIKGVLISETQFCDPEYYDYPEIIKMIEQLKIPYISVQLSDSIEENEQLKNRVSSFSEIINEGN